MPNNSLKCSNLLGQKPLVVNQTILPTYKRAEAGDLEAIFDMSRYFYNYQYKTESLNAALYYKSLILENYPLEEQGPYPYAVTMIEIAQIFDQLDQKEASKDYFKKCYKDIFLNSHESERRALLDEIEFFEVISSLGFEPNEIIVTTDY